MREPNFTKAPDGLLPAVIQDRRTGRILKVGLMNRKAFKRTVKHGTVTLYSRKRGKLVSEDGLESGGFSVSDLLIDCTGTSILITTEVKGTICRKGKDTCFSEKNERYGYLLEFERYLYKRIKRPAKTSYTTRLLNRGIPQVSKKLGEEAVELVIEALNGNDRLFKHEAADLLYYFMVTLAVRDVRLDEVLEVLKKRRK
ncbi:MAG: phosphoribosyl-ATP diphosphatase [Pyrinomonadaceae bacterium]|nr:phosphoribosyl-ATP diphosphatase [Pyrinomonadaceae bacterium]